MTDLSTFEPRVTAFVCNWCTYTGADLAGTSRLHMASNVRIVRLPCTGRIDHLFIVKAFERGADGVIVSGCHPADCHYTAGNYHARRRFGVFRELLTFMGLDPQRIQFVHPRAEHRFAPSQRAELITKNDFHGLFHQRRDHGQRCVPVPESDCG